MKLFLKSLTALFVIFSPVLTEAQKSSPADFSSLFKDMPFEMKALSAPVFPEREFSISDYGAVGDGETMNTKAFAGAIEACAAAGGGKVIVPAGIWLTGPVFLKSNVNLHLDNGAMIQFSKNYGDYPIIESNWEGVDQFRCTSPIMARNLTNIAITGSGIIDGGGEVWRPVKKYKMTANQWKDLTKSGVLEPNGNTWWPTQEAMDALKYMAQLKKENKKLTKADAEKYKVFFRPVMVSIVECKNVWLDGVTFQNSPAWNLHPFLCENVMVTNVNVRNPWFSQNGDGIDLESCKNALIYNSRFDVGDDAICMKSGKDAEGRKRGRPTENVLIKDCVVYHGHGGFTIGSEMSGGVKNIKVTNCNFIGTDVGLRFKSTRGRGGIVENIYIDNIFMNDIPTEALSFNLYYGGAAPTESDSPAEKSGSVKKIETDESTPAFRKIYLKDIYCAGAQDAVVLQGLPEMAIKDMVLENLVMTAERGISIYDADGIQFKNCNITSSKEPVINILRAKNIVFDKVEPKSNVKTFMRIAGSGTENIEVRSGDPAALDQKIEFGEGVQKEALSIRELK